MSDVEMLGFALFSFATHFLVNFVAYAAVVFGVRWAYRKVTGRAPEPDSATAKSSSQRIWAAAAILSLLVACASETSR